jgi:hypothetical protein
MNNIYCTECGTKVKYTYSKPKFCSNCGTGFGIPSKNKPLKKEKPSQPVKADLLREDETEIEEVPELYNGLAVETESLGNNVFSFESLMGERSSKRSARKRSININDFIDGRRN